MTATFKLDHHITLNSKYRYYFSWRLPLTPQSTFQFGLWEKGMLPLTDILQDAIKLKDPNVGALSMFLGIVRDKTESDHVKTLTLEAYEEEAINFFLRIGSKIKEEYSVTDIRIHHVIGDLTPGDLIMLILISGKSRKTVLNALKETVERVKQEAPLWKKETLMSGQSYWIEYQ
jgi:molybdopterin synthase catalytic subunit